jgi:hypothetical protein
MGKPGGKRPLEDQHLGQHLREIAWGDMDWIDLA